MLSRSTIRKIGAVGAALVGTLISAFVSSDLDFFKENILRPFQIRWSATRLESARAFSIAVHNASNKKVQLLIHQYGLPAEALIDFSSGAFKDGPQISYLDQIGRCPVLNQMPTPSRARIISLFDRHYKSLTLQRLQASLEQLWKNDTGHHMTPSDLQSFASQHNPNALECGQKSTRSRYCDSEKEYEDWERFVGSARVQSSEEWQKSTGLSVTYEKGFLAPNEGVYFSGTLEPNTTVYLLLRYGADPVAPTTELNTLGDISTEVSTDNDLHAETWKIAWKYHPLLTLLLFVIAFRFWWSTLAKPTLKEKPLFEVVNVALRTDGTDNDEIWDVVYNRIRLHMMSEFRAFCAGFKKAGAQLTSVEVFDHLRDRLRMMYGLTGQSLKNARELETNMHAYLRDLAART
jgi:hypothetical protein